MADTALNKATKRAAEDLESNIPKKKVNKQKGPLGKSEGCKRKIALLAAYNGKDYYGVQFNPGMRTIESEIFLALVKMGAIVQEMADTPAKMWFQRGSRTDKNVSAAVVLVPDFITKLNEGLPPQIKAFGYVRTTNGFDSKNWCESRTYMYMCPTFAFAPLEKFITDDYRVTSDILDRVREVLLKFVGTHKFHNFTSGVKYEEACAKRYIIKFECSEPYVRDGLEFVTMRVKGQSFMLHHIRKMIGLTIAIIRGYCPESTIESSWKPEKVDIPKAPGLGLVLEELHFDGYNKKFGCDGIHEAIEWSKYKEEMEKFKEEHIISSIVAQEKEDRVMFNWLRTLQYHNFDQVRLYGPQKPWHKMINQLEGKSPKSTSEVSTLSDVQPSEPGSVSDVQPSEAGTISDVQPSEAGTISDVQPSDSTAVSDAHPSEAATILDVKPSEAATYVQLNEASTKSDVQPSEASTISDVQPRETATISDGQSTEASTTSMLQQVCRADSQESADEPNETFSAQTSIGIEQTLNCDKTLANGSTDMIKVSDESVDDELQQSDVTEKIRQSIAKSS